MLMSNLLLLNSVVGSQFVLFSIWKAVFLNPVEFLTAWENFKVFLYGLTHLPTV